MGDLIQLFAGRKPETVTSEFWEWGQDFINEGVLDLKAVLQDIELSQDEHQLCAAIRELKQMAAEFPDCGE